MSTLPEQRLARLVSQLGLVPTAAAASAATSATAATTSSSSSSTPGAAAGASTASSEKKADTLTVTDNRTGKTYTLAITNGTIDASKLLQINNLRSYDPAYMNTASCTSAVCYIDGNKGILRYRGYPIEQLAEQSSHLEVSYLLIHGSLPDRKQLAYFSDRVMRHTFIHEDLKTVIKAFRYDAHPMGMVISTVSAMSTFHPEANPALAGQDVYKDVAVRNKNIYRMLGTIPTIAAYAYRHRIGRPYVDPAPAVAPSLTYCENFLYMLDKLSNNSYRPHPRLARALDILFILHADHEQNCSTAAMRHLASSGVDMYSCVAGAGAALYGPRHGGANEAVLRMLEQIGTLDNIPAFMQRVKSKQVRLSGFGHRVYRSYDPRARIIRKVADEVFSIVGREPLIEVAEALEKIALEDPFFVQRKLYPNVDFYSGLIYRALGFPTDYFPVLFLIPRVAGWLAHWSEFLDDPENKIVRPRQIYVGSGVRDYTPIDNRSSAASSPSIVAAVTAESKRRNASGTPP